jgi:hypothetical protein
VIFSILLKSDSIFQVLSQHVSYLIHLSICWVICQGLGGNEKEITDPLRANSTLIHTVKKIVKTLISYACVLELHFQMGIPSPSWWVLKVASIFSFLFYFFFMVRWRLNPGA